MATNPLLNAVGKLASKAKESVQSKAAAPAEEDGAGATAGKTASGALSLLSSLPWMKWVIIAGVLVFVFILISGVITGVSNAVSTAASSGCGTVGGGSKFVAEAEKNGATVSDDAKKRAKEADAACGGSGAGYTGQTYPPTTGKITTFFGVVDALHPKGHNGMDIAAECGAPIYAFAGGEVVKVVKGTEAKSTSGNYVFPAGSVMIKHTEEFSSMYLHLKGSETTVEVGDIVSAGDQIANQWSNGQSTGCHLHLEMYTNGARIDANTVLAAAGYNYSTSASFTAEMMPVKPVAGEDGASVPYTPGSAKDIARAQVLAKGWSESEFTNCLVPLWQRESGWRVDAINPRFSPSNPPTPEYQAYGIVQAAPGSKMATVGPDWQTNPATQITWGINYIAGRYGTPCGAWAHSESYNWY